MAVSGEVMASARKYRQSALGALLEAYWPVVTRVALGLCGERARAKAVVDGVMARALRALPKWRDETAADRWFYHHTVLEVRASNASAAPPTASAPGMEDALLPA